MTNQKTYFNEQKPPFSDRNDDIFHIVAEIKIKGYGCESGIPLFIPEVI